MLALIKISKSKTPVTPFEQEHFFKADPLLNDLPKRAMKNSHWFEHTFMRTRKKG